LEECCWTDLKRRTYDLIDLLNIERRSLLSEEAEPHLQLRELRDYIDFSDISCIYYDSFQLNSDLKWTGLAPLSGVKGR